MHQVEEKTMRFNDLSQDDKEDRSAQWSVYDTRRPKITLKHLNKMRNMKEMAKDLEAGKTFAQAHTRAMRKVGK